MNRNQRVLGEKPKQSFSDQVLDFDAFQEPFRFRLPGRVKGQGSYEFRTAKGVITTCILVSSLIFYGIMQSIKLVTFDETDVMVSSRDAYFSADHVMTENLWFAFGVTAYDSNREWIEDPSIGVLSPGYK